MLLNRTDVTGYISRINGHMNEKGTASQIYFDLQVPRYAPYLNKRVYDVIQCLISTALDKKTHKPLYPLYGHFAGKCIKNQKIRVEGVMKGYKETLVDGSWYRDVPPEKQDETERYYRITNQLEVTGFEILETKEVVEERMSRFEQQSETDIKLNETNDINPLFGDAIGQRYQPYEVME